MMLKKLHVNDSCFLLLDSFCSFSFYLNFKHHSVIYIRAKGRA